MRYMRDSLRTEKRRKERILVLVVSCTPKFSKFVNRRLGETVVRHVEDNDHVHGPYVSHSLLCLETKIAKSLY
jgi:hypothetical protein